MANPRDKQSKTGASISCSCVPTMSLLYRQHGCLARDVCRGESIVQCDLTEAGLVEVDLLKVHHLDRQPSVGADVGLQFRAVVRHRPFCYIHLTVRGVTAANCALENIERIQHVK